MTGKLVRGFESPSLRRISARRGPPTRRRSRASRRRAARRGAGRGRDAAVRVLRARAVLRVALRLLRLQHVRARGAGCRAGRRLRRRRARRDRPRGAGARRSVPRVDTVFFGGGTPTLLPADELIRILRRIDERFGLAPGAEVTTEANPESVDPAKLAALREGGFTRLSLGMQSAVPRVLEILDRAHSPGRPHPGRRRGARRRLRPGQPRPDLRHPGRDRGRLARLARRRAERRRPTISRPTR